MAKLAELHFDNSYTQLPEKFFARVNPTTVPAPYLVSFNKNAAALIDLDTTEVNHPHFKDYFSGNKLLNGSLPIATIYAGHQFGSYVPQLGDGRAILLGEVVNSRNEHWDLQLKGAGPTPFSRGFDGRAVLRSTIREYLCSEALHHLGIPTTRALSIIGSDLSVHRESIESAAILLRMAPSHVRFGSFEVFYYRKQLNEVLQLADYVIEHHYRDIIDHPQPGNKYAQFLTQVVTRTAKLMAQWQTAGFCHGVMNTDNMSILGITLDYGPFGFMEDFDFNYICNHSDHTGRYAYNQQPGIAFWNLKCLAQTLVPLMTDEEAIEALEPFSEHFSNEYALLMRAKLGFTTSQVGDFNLIPDLLSLMHNHRVDYTIFFRALNSFSTTDDKKNDRLRRFFSHSAAFDQWLNNYKERLLSEKSDDMIRKAAMDKVNAKYILRNYLAQQAIELAIEKRDYTEIERLKLLLERPFDEQPSMEKYAAPPPEWAKRIAVSCSS